MKLSSLWMAGFIFCTAAASAADGTKLLSACRDVVTQRMVPAGMNDDSYMQFCQCLVAKAGDNQAVVDEFVGITTAKPDAVQAKLASSSTAAMAVGAACQNHPFPAEPQLEMHVPFEPTAFPSVDRTYLIYELFVTNVAATSLTIQRLEVLDADSVEKEPIASFEAEQLNGVLEHFRNPVVGDRKPEVTSSYRELASGESAVLFLTLTLKPGASVPRTLRHRVTTSEAIAEGATIGTHHTQLHVLGPPLRGAQWQVNAGPNNNDSYHRRGILVFNGNASISRRYAIDWLKVANGATHSGDERDNRSYYAYGMDVLAVADGTITKIRDGIPENVPGHNGKGSRAVPLSIDTVSGNTIALDIGDGQFAHYNHLQPGSLRVKVGDRVRIGQVLAKVGDSGDAFEPHLHFEVSTSPTVLAGEGVPYLIDDYRILSTTDAEAERRKRELPLDTMVLDFGERQ
jgi:Peptidase family M23